MKVKIKLPDNRLIWALTNPKEHKAYINNKKEEVGTQHHVIILTMKEPGPIEVDLDEQPTWASEMILSSIKLGDLTGEFLDLKEEQKQDNQPPKEPTKKKIKK